MRGGGGADTLAAWACEAAPDGGGGNGDSLIFDRFEISRLIGGGSMPSSSELSSPPAGTLGGRDGGRDGGLGIVWSAGTGAPSSPSSGTDVPSSPSSIEAIDSSDFESAEGSGGGGSGVLEVLRWCAEEVERGVGGLEPLGPLGSVNGRGNCPVRPRHMPMAHPRSMRLVT